MAVGRVLFWIKHEVNGPYSSFRLKTRLWGENKKSFYDFHVTTDMIKEISFIATGRGLLEL